MTKTRVCLQSGHAAWPLKTYLVVLLKSVGLSYLFHMTDKMLIAIGVVTALITFGGIAVLMWGAVFRL